MNLYKRESKMNLYKCDGFRPIHQGDNDPISGLTIDDMHAAARIFATRMARREFGQRGLCRTVLRHTSPQDASYGNYEAFIGVPAHRDQNTTAGHRIWLVVSCVQACLSG